MAENDALAVAIQALAKNTDLISQDVRETRKSMERISEDNRDNAVKLERLLTQVEAFDQKAQKIDQISTRQDSMEIRLSMIEVQTKEIPENSRRLKILEEAKMKAIGIGTGVVVVLEIVFQLAKALWR